jgi:hypothetical protein
VAVVAAADFAEPPEVVQVAEERHFDGAPEAVEVAAAPDFVGPADSVGVAAVPAALAAGPLPSAAASAGAMAATSPIAIHHLSMRHPFMVRYHPDCCSYRVRETTAKTESADYAD